MNRNTEVNEQLMIRPEDLPGNIDLALNYLVQIWRYNRIPTNDLIEKLLDDYIPSMYSAKMEKFTSDEYDEGIKDGRSEAREDFCFSINRAIDILKAVVGD